MSIPVVTVPQLTRIRNTSTDGPVSRVRIVCRAPSDGMGDLDWTMVNVFLVHADGREEALTDVHELDVTLDAKLEPLTT